MIFIVMANGNGRPPACKIQEARTGNYVLIWSGLNLKTHKEILPELLSRRYVVDSTCLYKSCERDSEQK